jgi:hypothetical protein
MTVAAYCIIAALLVAFARRSFGVGYAVESSRYVLSSSFLPSAALALGAIALPRVSENARLHAALLSCAVALLSACAVIRAAQTPTITGAFRESYFSELAGKVAISAADHIRLSQYRRIFPWDDWEKFRSLSRFLTRRTGYTPAMWDAAFVERLASAKPTTAHCGFFDAQRVTPDLIRVHGWAYLPDRRERAHAVVVMASSSVVHPRIAAVAFTGIPRPDVSAAIKQPDAESTGWSIDIPASGLSGSVIRSFAYNADTGHVCRLPGEILPR